jgi:4-hydroxybenzoate polyprenyltransferase
MFPGAILAFSFELGSDLSKIDAEKFKTLAFAFLCLCLISSSNYVINEWLDRNFDEKHPMKNHRVATQFEFQEKNIYIQYLLLIAATALIAVTLNSSVNLFLLSLLIMGIIYNVKPIRTKDRHYIDVISESVNNPIRFSIGWFAIVPNALVPISAFLSYWGVGIFLMSLKRYSEMTIVNDKDLLESYRKSFKNWSPNKLLIFCFIGAVIASTFGGILIVRRHLEYILAFPFIIWVFAEYLRLSLELDPASFAPEKLFRKKKLQVLMIVTACTVAILTFIEIPFLYSLFPG